MPTLKPCPFCGEHEIAPECDERWYVECPNCDARSPQARNKVDVVSAWNRRAPLTVTPQMRERVARAICKAQDVDWEVRGDHIRMADAAISAITATEPEA